MRSHISPVEKTVRGIFQWYHETFRDTTRRLEPVVGIELGYDDKTTRVRQLLWNENEWEARDELTLLGIKFLARSKMPAKFTIAL